MKNIIIKYKITVKYIYIIIIEKRLGILIKYFIRKNKFNWILLIGYVKEFLFDNGLYKKKLK